MKATSSITGPFDNIVVPKCASAKPEVSFFDFVKNRLIMKVSLLLLLERTARMFLRKMLSNTSMDIVLEMMFQLVVGK